MANINKINLKLLYLKIIKLSDFRYNNFKPAKFYREIEYDRSKKHNAP